MEFLRLRNEEPQQLQSRKRRQEIDRPVNGAGAQRSHSVPKATRPCRTTFFRPVFCLPSYHPVSRPSHFIYICHFPPSPFTYPSTRSLLCIAAYNTFDRSRFEPCCVGGWGGGGKMDVTPCIFSRMETWIGLYSILEKTAGGGFGGRQYILFLIFFSFQAETFDSFCGASSSLKLYAFHRARLRWNREEAKIHGSASWWFLHISYRS